jgi:hypothetical protein
MIYNAVEIEAMYARREVLVSNLRTKELIDVLDLKDLDRLGRGQVADTLWERLSEGAKTELLCDVHPHVRSIARLSNDREQNLSAQEVRQLMRCHGVTIRELASRMRITMKRVREVREAGVVGRCMRLDWVEAITGTGMFAPESKE